MYSEINEWEIRSFRFNELSMLLPDSEIIKKTRTNPNITHGHPGYLGASSQVHALLNNASPIQRPIPNLNNTECLPITSVLVCDIWKIVCVCVSLADSWVRQGKKNTLACLFRAVADFSSWPGVMPVTLQRLVRNSQPLISPLHYSGNDFPSDNASWPGVQHSLQDRIVAVWIFKAW